MERMIRHLIDELTTRERSLIKTGEDEFLEISDSTYRLDEVEKEITRIYSQFVKFKDNNSVLLSEKNAAFEESRLCRFAQGMAGDLSTENLEIGTAAFSNIAGVVNTADKEKLSRTIFRATRGNAFCNFQEILEPVVDPKTGQKIPKSVFVAFCQGGLSSLLHQKVTKIAQAYGANLYTWPRDRFQAEGRLKTLEEVLADKAHAVCAYDRFLESEISELLAVSSPGSNSQLEEWRLLCAKEKQVYVTLNFFEGEVTLRADCWIPASEEESIRRLLQQQAQPGQISAMLLTDQEHGNSPPTFIKTTDFTRPFQDLVDTYGIPRYREINPALFATVTFPFLFGVMFGDVGHGSLLLLIGLWAMAKDQTFKKSFPPLYYARYLLVAMGVAAIYAGFMYSEFFAIGLNVFGSNFQCSHEDGHCEPKENYSAYPFGLDPAWAGASNSLLFINSLKMKLAVLFGVTQMLLGVVLKFSNAIYFKNKLDLFCECIPQFLFLVSVFGYMDWMIVYKWTHSERSPSLISAMINMGLMQPIKAKDLLYESQASVQGFLLFIAMISVPWMLLPKPGILWLKEYFANHAFIRRHRVLSEDSGAGLVRTGMPNHGKFDIGEIFIHQLIETIEFVLGSVSHTASYLRLWALSLAHQQLSLVFLGKILYPGLCGWWLFNALSIYVRFALFLMISVGILLGVDTLECFLHTLRLHWVEFQSKFYKGDGVKFEPFSHSTSLIKART